MSNSSIGVDVRNSLRADQLGINVHFVNLVRYHRAVRAVKRSSITGLKRFRINRMDENQRATGYSGSMDPDSTAYGVYPKRRGTSETTTSATSAAASNPPNARARLLIQRFSMSAPLSFFQGQPQPALRNFAEAFCPPPLVNKKWLHSKTGVELLESCSDLCHHDFHHTPPPYLKVNNKS